MNQEINRIHWKCRRGMREIDLLLREFAKGDLLIMDEKGISIFDSILDHDDQKLKALATFLFYNSGNSDVAISLEQ